MASVQEDTAIAGNNSENSKKLTELKVADLRNELEKRGKDKTGTKPVLVGRLTATLIEEGEDPAEYFFTLGAETTPSKNTPKRKSTSASDMSLKETEEGDKDVERDAEVENVTEPPADEKVPVVETSPVKPASQTPTPAPRVKREVKPIKSGLEAADIVQDALQLNLDDELNEDVRHFKPSSRSDTSLVKQNGVLDLRESSKRSSKASEERNKSDESRDKKTVNENGSGMSPPEPESAPVLAPLTVDDMISMDTSRAHKVPTDDVSLIVNVDDTQSELDGDLDTSTTASVKADKSPEKTSSKTEDKSSTSRSDAKKDGKEESKKESSSAKASDSKTSSKGKSSSSTSKNATTKIVSKDKKSGSIPTRNAWVSGLSHDTRASDLQTLFKKYGKVIGAKIITNTKIPGSRLYGLITMENPEQAENCIANLNKTELKGRVITVGKNRPSDNNRPTITRKDTKPREKKDSKNDDSKDKKSDGKGDKKKDEKERTRSPSRDRTRPFTRRPFIPLRRPAPHVPFVRRTFIGRPGPTVGMRTQPHHPNPTFLRRIESERLRVRERDFIDRRRIELARQDVERNARDERERLEREKEKLRIERERLEREKAELLRLERERARQEREKIEREREEIRRRQAQIPLRLLDEVPRGRPSSSNFGKRAYEGRDESYWDERKRPSLSSQAIVVPTRFDNNTGSRFSTDFDPRGGGGHNQFLGGRNDYDKPKMDLVSGGRNNDFDRRPNTKHGGNDRDERRPGFSSGGGNFPRDTRGRLSPRERDRRPGGGRDESWKPHESRRRDFGDNKGVGGSSYQPSGLGRGFPNNDFSSGDRNPNPPGIPSKFSSYPGAGLNDSRSRPPGMNPSIIGAGSASLSTMFGNPSLPMAGLMHTNLGSGGSLNDRPYLHSVRRF